MRRSLRCFAALQLETLEDRRLLAGNVISGYVFDDVNGNGLRDAGEPAIANTPLELRNTAGTLISTVTTDVNGFYQFDTDNTISNAVQSVVKTVTFANDKANTIRTQSLPQFDPSLGTLQSVEIKVDGKIISDIKIENLDDEVASVAGAVSGTVLVNGPGFNLNVSIAGNAAVAQTLAAFDGTIDFAGSSGVTLTGKTATGSNTQTLAGSAVNAFIGNGTVNLSFLAQATTQASGGGNLTANIANLGGGQVTVTYRYLNATSLKPGIYKIVEKAQPAGFLDGRDSQAGVIVANSINTDTLNVTLGSTDVTDNNFGEYRPGSLNGYVYQDNNNNGIREVTEQVFANMQIKLTGTNDKGAVVSLTGQTNAGGLYQFANLRPGQYTITQVTQPKGYSAGLITVGSLGGAKSGRVFSGVNVGVGSNGNDYNFGQLAIKVPSASGGGLSKGQLLGSTPVQPPIDVTVTNPGLGKGQLLGSSSTTSTTPTPPSSGGTVSAPAQSTLGKGQLLGSTPKPPAGTVVTNQGLGKGALLGSSPITSPTSSAGITVTRPAGTRRF